jgi:hypothetical protein
MLMCVLPIILNYLGYFWHAYAAEHLNFILTSSLKHSRRGSANMNGRETIRVKPHRLNKFEIK